MAEVYKYKKVRQENEQPTFILSTTDVKDYIQPRLDFIVATLRKKYKAYENLPNIQVEVFGSQASENYVPMMVILPPAVLRDESSNENDSIPGIYFNRDEDSQLYLIDEIRQFFRMYIYTKEDKKLFTNQSYLNEMKISPRIGRMIANFTEPRYRKPSEDKNSDDRSTDMVLFYIDPIRVFHDMLQVEGDHRKFTIMITKIKKIRDTQYTYHIKKQYAGKKKKRKNSFYREMDRFLTRMN